jgi:acyl-CoA thioesterase
MFIESVTPGHCRISMAIRGEMTNGHGIAHGGFIFSLADSAFAFACNSYNVRTVAQACDIVFVLPAYEGDLLLADAVERHRFGRNGIYDIKVTRGEDVVAEFRGHSRTIGGSVIADAESVATLEGKA